jgi:hypothetical protein
MSRHLSPQAFGRIVASLEATRNGPALYALISSFCFGGLLLAMAESALGRGDSLWGAVWGIAGIVVGFLGVNTTGALLMDQALGKPVREVADALVDTLRSAHRVLLSLAVVLTAAALAVGLLAALLWASRLRWVGAPLFAVAVPLGVLLLGAMALAGVVLVGPLTGPSVWTGHSAPATVRMLWRQLRHGLPEAAALMAAVLALTGAVTAATSFVVLSGARAMALLAVWGAGVDLPAQQLMAGLFGYGLRSLGAAGAPVAASPLGAAALIGGGMVFVLALVLPTIVYLSGCCAVYLALQDDAA